LSYDLTNKQKYRDYRDNIAKYSVKKIINFKVKETVEREKKSN